MTPTPLILKPKYCLETTNVPINILYDNSCEIMLYQLKKNCLTSYNAITKINKKTSTKILNAFMQFQMHITFVEILK